jgi:hypothetical protein
MGGEFQQCLAGDEYTWDPKSIARRICRFHVGRRRGILAQGELAQIVCWLYLSREYEASRAPRGNGKLIVARLAETRAWGSGVSRS